MSQMTIAIRLEATASRLEAIAIGWRLLLLRGHRYELDGSSFDVVKPGCFQDFMQGTAFASVVPTEDWKEKHGTTTCGEAVSNSQGC